MPISIILAPCNLSIWPTHVHKPVLSALPSSCLNIQRFCRSCYSDLPIPMTQAAAKQDDDGGDEITRGLCYIFSELGESYLPLLVQVQHAHL